MKVSEITVNVSCNLTIDENTAKDCLQLVQIYLNSHADIRLDQKRLENGEVELSYEPFTRVHGALPTD